MKPQQLKRTLVKCLAAGLPVLIKGAPGVGKTDLFYQAAAEAGMDAEVNHPVVADPTDPKGMPCIVTDPETGKKIAVFLPFGFLKRLIDAKRPLAVLLDDLGQAAPVVQAAYMQLLLARRVNGHKISDHVVFVAATNRREDKAAVTSVLEPVKSRFATIIEMTPTAEDWIVWAVENNIRPEVVGFIHFRPDLLNTGEATTDIVNHPSSRTWMWVSKLLDAGLNDVETIAGSVGMGAAAEFIGFLKVYHDLPNISAILTDPKGTSIPTEPSALFAVVSALVNEIKDKNANKVFTYVNRLPADFSVLFVRDAIRKNPDIQNSKGFIEWALSHKDIVL